MNQIQLLWQDDQEARLLLNGYSTAVYKASTGRLLKDAQDQRWFFIDVCHLWNESGKISVSAATVETLIKKIEAMDHVLPFIYSGKRVLEVDIFGY